MIKLNFNTWSSSSIYGYSYDRIYIKNFWTPFVKEIVTERADIPCIKCNTIVQYIKLYKYKYTLFIKQIQYPTLNYCSNCELVRSI